MAKACGIRIGPRRFEIVVLDGSPKKPKVVTSLAGEIPPDEMDPVGATAHALKTAIKRHGISTENVGLVLDARAAAFRNLSLPVEDASKIESVLKFEVESQLPQFNIDEVVVDFYIKEVAANSSSLLVTAVPKDEITQALEACNDAGFDPLEVEVETTALVNAAAISGLCGIEEAQVLVHVGEESTAVALVDAGNVREMRVIQAGALSYTPNGVPPTDTDEGEESEEGEDGEAAADDWDDYATDGPPEFQRVGEIVQRIRREIARTLSAARTVNELSGVYITGFVLPGLADEDILGVPVMLLESPDIENHEGDVHTEYSGCAIAFGAAVRQMGGGLIQPSLRREELKFSGAMERLELPLAVMCLLITTFLGVWFMFLEKERLSIDRDLRFMLESSVNYMMGDPKKGTPGNLEYPSDKLKAYVDNYTNKVPGSDPPEYRVDPERNRYEQLTYIRSLLLADQRELQKQMGQDTELVKPQSALKALTVVLDVIAQSDGKYGRVAFHSIDSLYRATSSNKPDMVIVTLEMAFFAESSGEASTNYETFFNDLKTYPWYVDHDYSRSDPIKGAESGAFLPNITIQVDVSKADEVKP